MLIIMNRAIRHRLLILAFTVSTVTVAHADQYSAEVTSSYNNERPEFVAMGFGDISYLSKEGSDADGFAIGQVVAHLSASMGHSFSVFGEFTLTANENEHSTGVERF